MPPRGHARPIQPSAFLPTSAGNASNCKQLILSGAHVFEFILPTMLASVFGFAQMASREPGCVAPRQFEAQMFQSLTAGVMLQRKKLLMSVRHDSTRAMVRCSTAKKPHLAYPDVLLLFPACLQDACSNTSCLQDVRVRRCVSVCVCVCVCVCVSLSLCVP